MFTFMGCSNRGKTITMYGDNNQKSGCISGLRSRVGTSWSDEMFYLDRGEDYMVHIVVKTHLPVILRALHFTIRKLNLYKILK